jgi:hypothetical protein
MKRKRLHKDGEDAQYESAKYEGLLAQLQEAVLLRNRRLQQERGDMSVYEEIRGRCDGDIALLRHYLQLVQTNKFLVHTSTV